MPALVLNIGVATCAKFIAEYLGLIENTSANTAALRHEPLKSAISWFENANNCTKEPLMLNYLQDARRKFMEAVSLEEYENKITAILGLSFCQLMLGDRENAEKSIQGINNVNISQAEVIKRAGKEIILRSDLVLHAKWDILYLRCYKDLLRGIPLDLRDIPLSPIKYENYLFELYKKESLFLYGKLLNDCK